MANSPHLRISVRRRSAGSRIITCLILAALFFSPHESSAEPVIPPEAVALYRLDPKGFDPGTTAVLPFLLQIAERNGLVEKDFHPVFDAVLVASTAGSVPHTACVLDFDAEYDASAARGYRVTRLKAVLVLESAQDHRSYLQTLGTILAHYREAGEDGEEIERVPDGPSIARFQADDWEDWQAVEWASRPESFVVGIGRGSIRDWIEAQQSAPDQSFIRRHRDTLKSAADERKFLDLWLNLDRLHETMPDVLAQGRIRSLLTAWQLDSARNWMLHGRWSGRYLLADITWQRRSESRDTVAHRALTLDHWPDALHFAEPPGSFVAIFPVDLGGVVDRILDVYGATQRGERKDAFERKHKQYEPKYRRTFRYLFNGFEPYIVLSDYPAPPLAIPGAATVYLELKSRLDPPNANPRIQALVEHFIPPKRSTHRDEPPQRPIHFDPATQIYWYEADSNGLIHLPVWGWSGQTLILGWGEAVVKENRQWLSENR